MRKMTFARFALKFDLNFPDQYLKQGKIYTEKFELDKLFLKEASEIYPLTYQLTNSFQRSLQNDSDIFIVTNLVTKKQDDEDEMNDVSVLRHVTVYSIIDTKNDVVAPCSKSNCDQAYDDTKFFSVDILNYYVAPRTVSVVHPDQNKFESIVETTLHLSYQNLDPESDYFTGKEKIRLMKPHYFSGTKCVFLKDYVACAARLTAAVCSSQNDVSGQCEQQPVNYLMVWAKQNKSLVTINQVFTCRIINLSDAPFSTRNSILENLGKDNSVLFINKIGYVVETTFNPDDVTFTLKEHQKPPYILSIIGTKLTATEIPGQQTKLIVYGSDLVIKKPQMLKSWHILIICLFLIFIGVLIFSCIYVRKRKILDANEDVYSSIIDEPNPEVRNMTLRRQDMFNRKSQNLLSEEEIIQRQDEIPEEFRSYFNRSKSNSGSGSDPTENHLLMTQEINLNEVAGQRMTDNDGVSGSMRSNYTINTRNYSQTDHY